MTTEVRTQTSEQAEGVSSLSGRCLTNEGYGCILCFRCGHCAFRGELGGSYGKKKKRLKAEKVINYLHIWPYWESLWMSLVERWRPPTGVCAVRYKERGEEEEIAHCEEMTVFIWFRTFSFQNSPSPWVSSLPSPPACIMGATPHNLRKIKREGRLGVPACHAFVDMGVYSVCVCVWTCWHQVSPVRYISSPSLNIRLQREHRAQVGW